MTRSLLLGSVRWPFPPATLQFSIAKRREIQVDSSREMGRGAFGLPINDEHSDINNRNNKIMTIADNDLRKPSKVREMAGNGGEWEVWKTSDVVG